MGTTVPLDLMGPGLAAIVSVALHGHRFGIVDVDVVTKQQQEVGKLVADSAPHTLMRWHKTGAATESERQFSPGISGSESREEQIRRCDPTQFPVDFQFVVVLRGGR